MMPPQQSMANMPPHSQHPQQAGYRMPPHQQRGYPNPMQQQQMMPQNGNQGSQMMPGQQPPISGYRSTPPQGMMVIGDRQVAYVFEGKKAACVFLPVIGE